MTGLLITLLATGQAGAADLAAWLDDEPLAAVYPPLYLQDVDPPLCTDEGVVDATQLPDMPGVLGRWDPERSWGSAYMIDALAAVAQHVQMSVPHADPLFVGDLSRRGGGWLEGHRTHRHGLDADIGLYTGDATQAGFKPVRPAQLDVETSWVVLEALLATERVDYVLLDGALIRALKSWLLAERILPEQEILQVFPAPDTERMWELDGIVRPAARHHDHMHVHFRCARWTPES